MTRVCARTHPSPRLSPSRYTTPTALGRPVGGGGGRKKHAPLVPYPCTHTSHGTPLLSRVHRWNQRPHSGWVWWGKGGRWWWWWWALPEPDTRPGGGACSDRHVWGVGGRWGRHAARSKLPGAARRVRPCRRDRSAATERRRVSSASEHGSRGPSPPPRSPLCPSAFERPPPFSWRCGWVQTGWCRCGRGDKPRCATRNRQADRVGKGGDSCPTTGRG